MNHISIDFLMRKCEELFKEKLKVYDLSWKEIKISSIIDQIFIKVIRIKNIQERGFQEVEDEKVIDTFIDVINYIVITLIKLNIDFKKKISHSEVMNIYIQKFDKLKELYDDNNQKESISIENLLEEILYLKQKKTKILYKKLENICLKMLNMTIFLLMKNIPKKIN
ncbi:conserved hypothetical protein [Blattabacterium sp. (Periplaneta americana) str. BPLAN]|uniref:DUF1599 domain-containing protein n=1 Tax=Blattabacterium sp. (Periplaneta americana) TaxID=367488 RepID=UPI0001BA0CED|nr:DUF1599 domain-containing protein [Blattabacterium sp. (Periplaneta americana)]ACX84136.1 conserved hypothetical protein [Blattabacterium sp. (Periplaneta americana) str. BPLAN]